MSWLLLVSLGDWWVGWLLVVVAGLIVAGIALGVAFYAAMILAGLLAIWAVYLWCAVCFVVQVFVLSPLSLALAVRYRIRHGSWPPPEPKL